MRDRLPLDEDEFTDVLSLQLDAHNQLQQKARNLLSITIAAAIATATLFSVGILEPIDLLGLSFQDMAGFSQDTIFTPREGRIIGFMTVLTQSALVIGTMGALIVSYVKLADVFQRTQIEPLIGRDGHEFYFSSVQISRNSDRQALLNDNAEYINESYKRYQTAITLLYFSFVFGILSYLMLMAVRESSIFYILTIYIFPYVLFLFTLVTMYSYGELNQDSKAKEDIALIWTRYFPGLTNTQFLIIRSMILGTLLTYFVSSIFYIMVFIWAGMRLAV